MAREGRNLSDLDRLYYLKRASWKSREEFRCPDATASGYGLPPLRGQGHDSDVCVLGAKPECYFLAVPRPCPSQSHTDGECHAPHDARHLANPAAAGPVRPGRLGRVRRALRAAHLPVVPAVEVTGRRRRGRDPGHPDEAQPRSFALSRTTRRGVSAAGSRRSLTMPGGISTTAAARPARRGRQPGPGADADRSRPAKTWHGSWRRPSISNSWKRPRCGCACGSRRIPGRRSA